MTISRGRISLYLIISITCIHYCAENVQLQCRTLVYAIFCFEQTFVKMEFKKVDHALQSGNRSIVARSGTND